MLAGPRSMRNSAIGCACLLAIFEGIGIGLQRTFAPPPMVHPLPPPVLLFPSPQLYRFNDADCFFLLQAPELPQAPTPAAS